MEALRQEEALARHFSRTGMADRLDRKIEEGLAEEARRSS